jgi:hypothetical protein
MKVTLHYFEEIRRVSVVLGRVSTATPSLYRIRCGATDGEATDLKREVTCPECVKLLAWDRSSDA